MPPHDWWPAQWGPVLALNFKLFFVFPVIFILPRIVTRYHATTATPFVDDEGRGGFSLCDNPRGKCVPWDLVG